MPPWGGRKEEGMKSNGHDIGGDALTPPPSYLDDAPMAPSPDEPIVSTNRSSVTRPLIEPGAMVFTKATKEQSLLRLGLVGPAGAGKTWTALTIACQIARMERGRVAVIDTEEGSAAKYADIYDFDHLILHDYAPHNYVAAITAAEEAGYPVIVIDSASHAWDEILDEKDRKSAKNQWGGWSDLSPKYRAFIEKQKRCTSHLIATLRGKTQFVVEERNGKQVPRKVGMGAVVRPGYDFEYDIVGYLDTEHDLTIEKTRFQALDGKHWPRPDSKFAAGLYHWLRQGVKAKPKPAGGYDTGGHPEETKAAPQAVAEQKIATGTAATSKPWKTFGEFKRTIEELRAIVGNAALESEMERQGCHDLKGYLGREDEAVELYHHLKALAEKGVQ